MRSSHGSHAKQSLVVMQMRSDDRRHGTQDRKTGRTVLLTRVVTNGGPSTPQRARLFQQAAERAALDEHGLLSYEVLSDESSAATFSILESWESDTDAWRPQAAAAEGAGISTLAAPLRDELETITLHPLWVAPTREGAA